MVFIILMDPVEDGHLSIGVIVDMFALTGVEELVDIVKEVSVVGINSVTLSLDATSFVILKKESK